jgi:hypothetical protein
MENWLEVIDRDGWRRGYPLDKNLIYIGSAAQNDIVLGAGRGTGVSPRHLQLMPLPGGGAGFRLINLSDQELALDRHTLQPRSFVDVGDGQRLDVGDFTLVFHGSPNGLRPSMPAASAMPDQNASQSIGLIITLSHTDLSPQKPLEGGVTVQNLGEATGAQFQLHLEGLEADYYELEPGPILFPNAKAELFLRLFHPRQPRPAAGHHRINIHATAPDAYPGERATVGKVINILPFFHHTLSLIPSPNAVGRPDRF